MSSGCWLCPWECDVDRRENLGVCCAPDALKIAQAQCHFYEEPCLSGERGSGTVFFSHCNLHCKFCQNFRISHQKFGRIIDQEHFKKIILNLQKKGVHNINFVSPTPYSKQIKKAITDLKVTDELKIPIVWNSNGYEKAETLEELSGLVDIYLPDLKYFSDDLAFKFSGARDYFKWSSTAILEMRRQQPADVYDGAMMMMKGVIIRHLVLPGQLDDSKVILKWIRENLGDRVVVSLMAQYCPAESVINDPVLGRRLTVDEYKEISDYFMTLGFEEGFVQELSSAESFYTPDFKLDGI